MRHNLQVGDIIVFNSDGLNPRYGYKGQTAIVEQKSASNRPRVRLLSPRADQIGLPSFIPSDDRYKKV